MNDLVKAARQLTEKLRVIEEHPAYQGVWVMAGNHGMAYCGPTYKNEIESLEAQLAKLNDGLTPQ